MDREGGRGGSGGATPGRGVRASGPDSARRILSLLDLTSLNEDDTARDVRELCASAYTPLGTPAAVCVWPRFVEVAAEALKAGGMARAGRTAGREGSPSAARGVAGVRIATVTNFPAGDPDPEAAAAQTADAVARGAHEVDVVFPWRAFLAGDREVGAEVVAACREACGTRARLKVILETGELADPDTIRAAARSAAEHGADFLKTSTGKVPAGATPEAVAPLLEVIREHGGAVGLKISGGVRTVDQAAAYLERIAAVMGEDWITPERVRFGSSSLLRDVRARG